MNADKNLMKRIRGWFPKEPALNGIKTSNFATDEGKAEPNGKAFKVVAVADGVTVGVFAGTHNLIDPNGKSVELTILSWSVFVLALIAENVVIYRHYKQLKQPNRWFKRWG